MTVTVNNKLSVTNIILLVVFEILWKDGEEKIQKKSENKGHALKLRPSINYYQYA